MESLDDILKHHGVKGMKWGVRKDRKPKQSSQSGSKLKSTIRELSGYRDLTKMKKMSTKEIKQKAERLRLENELKKYTKSSAKNIFTSTAKSRQDYLNRSKMSDKELKRKVERLQAQKLYQQRVSDANRGTRDIGKQAIKMLAPVAMGYAAAKAPNMVKKIKDPAVREFVNVIVKQMNK